MKKALVTIIVVLAMLAMFVGTVAAAPLTAGTATLVSVVYVPGKGPVFTFEVSGKFTQEDLKGALHVDGGADFELYCDQIDSTTVKCTVSKEVAGKNVVLSWGGATYWASVPVAQGASPSYCYSIYDYDTSYTWQNYGTYCQDEPAEYGDAIPWYNPDWGDNLDHIFLPELSCSGLFEDAYYLPLCPL